jgi:hypothetical protein
VRASSRKPGDTMPDWVPLNLGILKNPMNWFIVFFMVLIPLLAVTFIHERMLRDGTAR